MPRLLLVDGTNLIMWCAWGGEHPPEQAFPVADAILTRVAAAERCSHAVIAFDNPDVPSCRRDLFDGYKADRKTSTAPFIAHAGAHWSLAGWRTMIAGSFEADDIIATLVGRLVQSRRLGASWDVRILSGDSDLHTLAAYEGVKIVRLLVGGGYDLLDAEHVEQLHGVPAWKLPWLKALAGEPSDCIPGPFGKHCVATARKLLTAHATILDVFRDEPRMTPERRAIAEQALELVRLRTNVPLPPVHPSTIEVPRDLAHAASNVDHVARASV